MFQSLEQTGCQLGPRGENWSGHGISASTNTDTMLVPGLRGSPTPHRTAVRHRAGRRQPDNRITVALHSRTPGNMICRGAATRRCRRPARPGRRLLPTCPHARAVPAAAQTARQSLFPWRQPRRSGTGAGPAPLIMANNRRASRIFDELQDENETCDLICPYRDTGTCRRQP